MIPCADLFSGGGGLSMGAHLAGASVAFAADHWDLACKWHAENFPGTAHACQDLQQFDFRQLPDLSSGLLLAAPECQGHSSNARPARAGSGGSHSPSVESQAERTRLQRSTAWAVVTAAEVSRPRAIVIENVREIRDWPLFAPWLECFERLGYTMRTHVLDSALYGSAQDRTRCIITGDRDGMGIRLADSWGASRRSLSDCIDLADGSHHRWRKGGIAAAPERMRVRMRKAQREAGPLCVWNNVSESRGRRLDERAPTLTTKSGSQLYLLDGERCRILNPRELARIQGLPESYQLPTQRAVCSELIGNMVPVELSHGVISQTLAQVASEAQMQTPYTLTIDEAGGRAIGMLNGRLR